MTSRRADFVLTGNYGLSRYVEARVWISQTESARYLEYIYPIEISTATYLMDSIESSSDNKSSKKWALAYNPL